MSHRWCACLSALLVFSLGIATTRLSAQTGNFAVVLNEAYNWGDSRKSVTYYDADDLASGPLFSVFLGYEYSTNYEDPNAIDVDPATGDVYVLGFDSGTPGDINDLGTPTDPSDDDGNGDLDLYKIDFSLVYSHWENNFKGKDVRSLGGDLQVGGDAPTGSKNALNLDYVTYGDNILTSASILFNFDVTHSNTFVLPGARQKIGEINRNGAGGDYYPTSLEFIDQSTLLLLDDSTEADNTVPQDAANDHQYRIIRRVSASPGAATSDGVDGGYNNGTTESWESQGLGRVNLDFAEDPQNPGTYIPTGHSEAESTAYYNDPQTGVRGVWVTESDGGGDDVAFYEIDSSGNGVGYRPHATTGNPTAFALDNDPYSDPTSNDGKADNVFVDQDTGDVIIMESGYLDSADGIGPDHEPAVIRREVLTYDNGLGQIQFGAWSEKVILNPTKTPGENPLYLERGQWTAYDSENDLVYVFAPGSAGETPEYEMDIWVLDINTGITTSYLDLDESVSLFGGDSFGDKVDFFSLSATEDADFDGDGDVDGNDFLAWQGGHGIDDGSASLGDGDANGDGNVNAADLAIWSGQFGSSGSATAALNTVPEPTSVALLAFAIVASSLLTRQRIV
jgi:hypothetical protein